MNLIFLFNIKFFFKYKNNIKILKESLEQKINELKNKIQQVLKIFLNIYFFVRGICY